MCGAIDCPSCGPAQGYEVVRVWISRLRRFRTMTREDALEEGFVVDDDGDIVEDDEREEEDA
jgi:hypothetical protein